VKLIAFSDAGGSTRWMRESAEAITTAGVVPQSRERTAILRADVSICGETCSKGRVSQGGRIAMGIPGRKNLKSSSNDSAA
jgi:hypothetical protein